MPLILVILPAPDHRVLSKKVAQNGTVPFYSFPGLVSSAHEPPSSLPSRPSRDPSPLGGERLRRALTKNKTHKRKNEPNRHRRPAQPVLWCLEVGRLELKISQRLRDSAVKSVMVRVHWWFKKHKNEKTNPIKPIFHALTHPSIHQSSHPTPFICPHPPASGIQQPRNPSFRTPQLF